MSYHASSFSHQIAPDIQTSLAQLKRGDAAHVEPILGFLERDIYIHGSGYQKENIWRYLHRVPLNAKQHERLRAVALLYVRRRQSREFLPMCRFIRTIANAAFEKQVQQLENASEPRIQQRARLLAAYLKSESYGETLRFDSTSKPHGTR